MKGKKKGTFVRVHAVKWPGVYYYEMATLYNGKPDRCFYYAYQVGKKKYWKKVGRVSEGFTPDIAADYKARDIVGLTDGSGQATPKEQREEQADRNRTIGEIGDIYFRLKDGSVKGIKTDISRFNKHIKPRFGKCRVGEIKSIEVEELKVELMKVLSPATVWNILELFRRMVNYGFQMELCPRLGFVIAMPEKENEKVEYLTPEQSERFLSVIRNWTERTVSRMFQMAYFTGMRKGEIFKLKESDLDFELGLISIRSPKSGKASETIGMGDLVKELLREQLTENRKKYPNTKERYVFPGKDPEKPRTECSAADRIREKAELPPGFRPFHGLRHNYGVMLANSGQFNMTEIAEALTHKSVDFTRKRYAQFLPETKTKMGNAAAKILDFPIQARVAKGE